MVALEWNGMDFVWRTPLDPRLSNASFLDKELYGESEREKDEARRRKEKKRGEEKKGEAGKKRAEARYHWSDVQCEWAQWLLVMAAAQECRHSRDNLRSHQKRIQMDKCHHPQTKDKRGKKGRERREKYITLARRPACKGPRRSRGVRSSIVLSCFGSKGEPGRGGRGERGSKEGKRTEEGAG